MGFEWLLPLNVSSITIMLQGPNRHETSAHAKQTRIPTRGCGRPLGFCFLVICRLPLAAQSLGKPAAAPKRVLVVHSFSNAAPPFTSSSTAFERALIEEMGESIDLDEVSLDVARYATLDMEEGAMDGA